MEMFMLVLLHILRIFFGYFLPALGTLELLADKNRTKFGTDYDKLTSNFIYYWILLVIMESTYGFITGMLKNNYMCMLILVFFLAAILFLQIKSVKLLDRIREKIDATIKGLKMQEYIKKVLEFVLQTDKVKSD